MPPVPPPGPLRAAGGRMVVFGVPMLLGGLLPLLPGASSEGVDGGFIAPP